MYSLLRKFFLAVGLLVSAAATPSQAALLGNLNDGLPHVGSVTGQWSLFVNAGDVVYVQALRLTGFDPIMGAFDGPNGTGSQIAYGDDDIPGNSGVYGGGFWDPAFTFTAFTTGEYTIWVSQYPGFDQGLALPYSVQATGATGNAPLPGTLALLGFGLGLVAFGFSRRSK